MSHLDLRHVKSMIVERTLFNCPTCKEPYTLDERMYREFVWKCDGMLGDAKCIEIFIVETPEGP